jgi:hypothetical protein
VIEIGALKGKGYPAPVALDTGSGKTKVASGAPPEARKATIGFTHAIWNRCPTNF